jgi:hypothetical protein
VIDHDQASASGISQTREGVFESTSVANLGHVLPIAEKQRS